MSLLLFFLMACDGRVAWCSSANQPSGRTKESKQVVSRTTSITHDAQMVLAKRSKELDGVTPKQTGFGNNANCLEERRGPLGGGGAPGSPV